MPVETAITIEQLDESWPLSGDFYSPCAIHIKTIKGVLKKIFPGENGAGFDIVIDATEIEINHTTDLTENVQDSLASINLGGSVIGTVIFYSGLFSAIPTNWQLCDGTSGTQDLTDKFIYANPESGLTGGFADNTVAAHSHTATHGHTATVDAAGNHSHTTVGSDQPGSASGFITGSGFTGGFSTGTEADHTHQGTVDSGFVTSGITGVSGVGTNIPNYIKLASIQRIT